jgi:hypothetical protein
MRTLWIKILILFLSLTLLENIGFPLAANHGRLDVQNKSMQPYLVLAALAFVSIIFLFFMVYKKPLPQSSLYNLGKFIMPLIAILLIVNIANLVPVYLTVSSVLIFTFHVFGVLVSLWITVRFFLNRTLI